MDAKQVMVKMVLDRWYTQLKNADDALDLISDEQLYREVAPGKNRGIYLLGHLIAVHDDMLPILNFGERLFPELQEPFLKLPDKAATNIPSATELKALWTKSNAVLADKINSLQPEEWFQRHTSVSAQDFEKEPHRNKLNIIITRTSHLSHHLGQLILLK